MLLHNWREFAKQFQFLRRLGIPWLAGITAPGQAIQSFSVTGGGTGTDAVVLAAISVKGQLLKAMADTDYQVLISGEFAGAQGNSRYCDESTKTTAGFNLVGLAGGEVCHVVVIGRLDGMPDPTL